MSEAPVLHVEDRSTPCGNNHEEMTMKAATIALTILLTLATVLAAPAAAFAQTPDLPHLFCGALTIDGALAPAGATVEGRATGALINPARSNPIVTTQAGEYGATNATGCVSGLLVQGSIAPAATIEFFVNGTKANETAAWQSGAATRLNLTLGIFPLPAPTKPTAPSGLTANVFSPTRIDLSWSDNATNETAFSIEKSTNGGAFSAIGSVAANVRTSSDATVSINNTYAYRIIAVSAGGNSEPSNVAQVTTFVPAAPSGLTAVAANDLQVNLNWVHTDTLETGFRIQRATTTAFTTPTLVGTVAANVTSFSDSTVQPSTQYSYRVVAMNSIGDSAASNTASVTTPPARPNNLRPTRVEITRIEMAWVDNANNETGFRVQRATDEAFTQNLFEATTGLNQTTFRDQTFTAPVNFYRVLASNANGNSGPSNVIRVATAIQTPPGTAPGATVPAAPTNLSATAIGPNPAGLRIDLAWRDASNTETGFRIQRSTVSTFATVIEFTVDFNVTAFSDTSVVLGATYFYRVLAFNAVGNSLPSNVRQVRTRLTGTFLNATVVGPTQVDLRWTDDTTDETGFRIERSLDGVNFAMVRSLASADTPGTAAEITFSDTQVTPATTFFYQVTPFSAAGNLAASNIREVLTPAKPGTPNIPTNLSLTVVSETQVVLEWQDNSGNETGFPIERSTDGALFTMLNTVGAGVTAFSDSQAPAATTLWYRVIAVNGAGRSLPSDVREVTTAAVNGTAAAPSNLSDAIISPNRVDLTWRDNSNGTASFRIQRSLTATFVTPVTFLDVARGVTTFSDVTAAPGTTYFYRVIAVGAIGNSIPSAARQVVTPDPTAVPVAPIGLNAMATGTSTINLSWTDSSDNEAGFRIERCLGATCSNFAPLFITTASATAYTDAGLDAGTTYRYRVVAINTIGASAPVGPLSATTQTPPPPPQPEPQPQPQPQPQPAQPTATPTPVPTPTPTPLPAPTPTPIPLPVSPPAVVPTPVPSVAPTSLPEKEIEGKLIAEDRVDQARAFGEDTSGKIVLPTGDTMRILASSDGKMAFSLPVTLPQGSSLKAFDDPGSGARLQGDTLTKPVKDSSGKPVMDIIAKVEKSEGTGTSAVVTLKSAALKTREQQQDLSAADPRVGKVAANVHVELKALPDGAAMKVTLDKKADDQTRAAIEQAVSSSGQKLADVAFVINIQKTLLENNRDLGAATITMKVSSDWVAAHGGATNVKIIRVAENGEKQVLQTRVAASEAGSTTFEGASPKGLSAFALAAIAPAQQPQATPTPAPATVAPTPEPVAPEFTPTPTPMPAPVAPTPTPAPAASVPPPAVAGAVTQAVDPAKAVTLELPDGTRIEVPARAMSASMQMQARVIPAADLPSAPAGHVVKALDIVLFDLQGKPLGPTDMAIPVVIQIPLSDEDIRLMGNNPLNARVAYLDPAKGEWETVSATADLANKVVNAQVTHMSLFALVIVIPQLAAEGGMGWLIPTIIGIMAVIAAAAILLYMRRRQAIG